MPVGTGDRLETRNPSVARCRDGGPPPIGTDLVKGDLRGPRFSARADRSGSTCRQRHRSGSPS